MNTNNPTRATAYTFFDACGNEAENGTGTAEEAAQRAAEFILAQAAEGMAGRVEFSDVESATSVAYVDIDYEPYPDFSDCREGSDPNRELIALCTLAYNAAGKPIGGLSNSVFYEDGGDWTTGQFAYVSDIPEECDHLREVAKDLGLPA